MFKKIINKIKNNNKREITCNITIEKVNQILCVTIFLSIIIVMPLFTFARSENDYIYYENRLISPMPKMRFSTLLDGRYMQDFEEYFSDILFLRNRFLIMNVIYEKYLMNKDVVNNIIIDKTNLLAYHGYDDLFESANDKYCYQSAMRVKKLSDALNKDDIPFYYIGIPQQMSYLASKYPKYYYNGEYHFDSLNKTFSKDLENIGANFINIREYFNSLDQTENEKNDMYYHTDHHYTFIAAYKAYEKIINTLNSDNNVLLKIKNNENLEKKLFMYNEKDIEFKYLPNTFVGSLGRKLTNRFDRGDKLIVPIKKEVPFVRYDNGKKVESILMAIPNNEYEEVSYSSYMGGDIANTVIDTNRPYLPNILIYGDSYTNPLEMLLYASFNQMHSIDFRLFSKKDIMKYIRDNQIDIVLCIKDDTSYFYETGNGAVLVAG